MVSRKTADYGRGDLLCYKVLTVVLSEGSFDFIYVFQFRISSLFVVFNIIINFSTLFSTIFSWKTAFFVEK
jgi:hypothetical protein